MITGKTKNGFKFSYDERILKDWDFISAISKAQSSDDVVKLQGATEMITLLLGSDGVIALRDFIKSKNDGFAPVDAMMAEITDILQSRKIKN